MDKNKQIVEVIDEIATAIDNRPTVGRQFALGLANVLSALEGTIPPELHDGLAVRVRECAKVVTEHLTRNPVIDKALVELQAGLLEMVRDHRQRRRDAAEKRRLQLLHHAADQGWLSVEVEYALAAQEDGETIVRFEFDRVRYSTGREVGRAVLREANRPVSTVRWRWEKQFPTIKEPDPERRRDEVRE